MANLRICLLNIRGCSTRKIDYVLEKIKWNATKDYPHILCMTETNISATHGSISSLKYSYNHHISIDEQGKYFRTAIIIRKGLKIKEVTNFTYRQKRWSKPGVIKSDNRSIFANAYEIEVGNEKVTLINVYRCPDADKKGNESMLCVFLKQFGEFLRQKLSSGNFSSEARKIMSFGGNIPLY